MTKINQNRIKLMFYLFIGLVGFALLLLDTTPGHNFLDHLDFLRNNFDAIEGILFIFISSFEIGQMYRRKSKI